MIFFFADGHFYVETSSVTRKARNAAARQHATLLIQGVGSEGRNLMLSAEGSARIPHGNDARETNRRVRAKYIRPEALDALDWA